MDEAAARVSRRTLIGLAAGGPFVVMALQSAHAQDAACVDLARLPLAQRGMRRSIGFKLVSPDPKKHCSGCAFFTGTSNGCGTCKLLNGGAVAASSVCDSFAPKA